MRDCTPSHAWLIVFLTIGLGQSIQYVSAPMDLIGSLIYSVIIIKVVMIAFHKLYS
jgi:hypothetical protein